MQHKLKALDAETLCYAAINLNSFSDAPALQTILEQSLEKKSGAWHASIGIPQCRLNIGHPPVCKHVPSIHRILSLCRMGVLQACASARQAASA